MTGAVTQPPPQLEAWIEAAIERANRKHRESSTRDLVTDEVPGAAWELWCKGKLTADMPLHHVAYVVHRLALRNSMGAAFWRRTTAGGERKTVFRDIPFDLVFKDCGDNPPPFEARDGDPATVAEGEEAAEAALAAIVEYAARTGERHNSDRAARVEAELRDRMAANGKGRGEVRLMCRVRDATVANWERVARRLGTTLPCPRATQGPGYNDRLKAYSDRVLYRPLLIAAVGARVMEPQRKILTSYPRLVTLAPVALTADGLAELERIEREYDPAVRLAWVTSYGSISRETRRLAKGRCRVE